MLMPRGNVLPNMIGKDQRCVQEEQQQKKLLVLGGTTTLYT